MTYKDNFVVEVKCNGKILRVKNDSVYLPFGSEYSLLLKNLNSRRASIRIHIDDQDVLDYSSLILEANSSTELEGFLSGTIAKNKFKFIQKTKQVQDYRGDKLGDGLIRVEFAFEKPKPETRQIITEKHEHHHHHYDYYHWWPSWATFNSSLKNDFGSGTSGSGDASGDSVTYSSSMDSNIQMSNTGGAGGQQLNGEVRACFSNVVQDSLGVESLGQPLDDEGITVKGSDCYQQFRYGSIGELEQSKVITISLKGFQVDSPVQEPVTVRTRFVCSSCGKRSRSSFTFCPDCGTRLG